MVAASAPASSSAPPASLLSDGGGKTNNSSPRKVDREDALLQELRDWRREQKEQVIEEHYIFPFMEK